MNKSCRSPFSGILVGFGILLVIIVTQFMATSDLWTEVSLRLQSSLPAFHISTAQ